MNMTTNMASRSFRRLATLAVLTGAVALAGPARADSIKPVVNAGSSVFNTVADLVTAAIKACRSDSQIAPNGGKGKTLGLGLRCPGTQPPDVINDVPKVSCTFNGSLSIKGGLSGAGASGTGSTTATVKATTTSTDNRNIDHHHQSSAPKANQGTCPKDYVNWVTVLETDVEITLTVDVEVNGVVTHVTVNASAQLGGGVKNYSFYDTAAHGGELSCTTES